MKPARWPRFAAALAGFAWYLYLGGGPTLNPTNVAFVLGGDWRQHWLGWLFFRHEPWTFPLGRVSNLLYPIGTTIGFTDSNPLVSLMLKPFSGLLPAEFQFIGPWLALCFVLQGYAGAALTSAVTKDPRQQLLGGVFFVMSPVLAARMGHDTLCAHWLLLGLLYLGLREYAGDAHVRRAAWLAAGAAVLSASIHPYLAAICFILAQVCFLRLWLAGLLPLRRAAAAAIGTTAGVLAVFGAIGYFGAAGIGSAGFGNFSSDLLSLVNSAGFSRLLPRVPVSSEQWEGLGFIGLGGIVATVVAVVGWARIRPTARAGTWAVVAVCVLMGVYALSIRVTLAGDPVARLGRFYDHIRPLTAAFRASGRFIWPLHYLVLLLGIWGMVRVAGSRRLWIGTALLAATVAVQAADFRMDPAVLGPKVFKQVPADGFTLAAGRYRHLVVFPMQVLGVCHDPTDDAYIYRFMLEAYRLNLTYNSGIFARLPRALVLNECIQLEEDVRAGGLNAQTIYAVSADSVPDFKRANAACGRFDGDWICVSRDSDERFRTFVETGK